MKTKRNGAGANKQRHRCPMGRLSGGIGAQNKKTLWGSV
jgi:hypothetical protein